MRGSCSPRKLARPPSLLLRCSQSLQQTWLVGPLTDDTELTKERSHQRRNHDRREHRNFCGVCFPKSGDIRREARERERLSYYSCAARDAAAQVHGGTSCRIFCRRFFSRKPPSLIRFALIPFARLECQRLPLILRKACYFWRLGGRYLPLLCRAVIASRLQQVFYSLN